MPQPRYLSRIELENIAGRQKTIRLVAVLLFLLALALILAP